MSGTMRTAKLSLIILCSTEAAIFADEFFVVVVVVLVLLLLLNILFKVFSHINISESYQ